MNAIPRPLIAAFFGLAIFNIYRGVAASGPSITAQARASVRQHAPRPVHRPTRPASATVVATTAAHTAAHLTRSSSSEPRVLASAVALDPYAEDLGQNVALMSPLGTPYRPR